MSWGVRSSTSGRRWGRAGVVMLAVFGTWAPAAVPRVAEPRASLDGNSVADFGADFVLADDLRVLAPGDGAILEAPAAFDGPPPPTGDAVPQLDLDAFLGFPPEPTGDGVWAVIIGVNDYPGSRHDLRYARNDADDMDAALARFGVPPERRLRLRDGQATAGAIGGALDWLARHAGPNATVVFSYAGHVRKLDSTTEALVGADGQLLTDAEVAWRLGGLQARTTWLVIEGCYGGGFTELLAPGRILTGASPANQLAYESSSLGRSYLGEYLVRRALLEGRADQSVEAAFAWAFAELRRDHPKRLPVQFDEVDGELAFGAPRTAATPAPARSEAPSSTTTTTEPPRSNPVGTKPQDDGQRECLLTFGSTIQCPADD